MTIEELLQSVTKDVAGMDNVEKLQAHVGYLVQENQRLNTENAQLKVALTALEPVITISSDGTNTPISDEEFVCVSEIRKLRKLTETQELTYEQSKKLDIYIKNLLSIRNKDKEKEKKKEVQKLSEEELLASLHVV